MTAKSLEPPERNGLAAESKTPAGLLGSGQMSDYGQQLSSFTEFKLGKKSGTLFAISGSPLKVD